MAAQQDAAAATTDPLSIAYYCTGHGLGHATRSIEVCKHLVGRGHTVTVVTGAPARVFLTEVPSARFVLRKAVLDAGAKQLDPFTVDVKGSLDDYFNTVVLHREPMLDAEVQWLRSNHVDLVVSDVVPLACAAAAAAGVPAVCVSNFSWDFIYSEYLTTQRRTEFRRLVWQIAQDYASAALLLRLPGYVPMPAFTAIEDVPLVVRHARKLPSQVRAELGLAPDARLAVLIHGGHKAELSVTRDFLPAGWVCVACNGGRPLGPDPLPPNFQLAPADVYTPDLVAACDCVIGKIGYGTMSECLAHGRPLVFVRRDFFNEEPFLRKLLEVHGAAVEMKRRDFLEGHWGPYLTRATRLSPRYSAPTNGAEVVAARLEEVGRGQAVPRFNSLARLRDTVVFGYLMATPKHGRVDVPDWYVNGADPSRRLGSYRSLRDALPGGPGDAGNAALRDWTLLQGDPKLLQHLPDTAAFLQLLHNLHSSNTGSGDSAASSSAAGGLHPLLALAGHEGEQRGSGNAAAAGAGAGAAGDAPASGAAGSGSGGGGAADRFSSDLPEVRAAMGLFRWDDELLVTRAPGRLDVMGGIADYSGSSVLQMPIAEACHVALQRHPLDRQPLWKHIQARHDKLGGPRAALRVVSYHADDTNRAPTFDLDLDDLLGPDGAPIPYAQLRSYFKQDPAGSWGAYVAGCLLVLAREKGLRYSDGLSILVCSDVPEGKGVSSSAALEVAVMSALAAAHELPLGGRELAMLCQKAENLVVGAPCGVMDQLTASLGDEGQLLALLCQPAEVLGCVPIPPQIRFWGIDSGIRHSVGGSDYHSVRVGAFMGLKLASEMAAQQQQTLARSLSASMASVLTAAGSSLQHGTQQQQPSSSSRHGGGGFFESATPQQPQQQPVQPQPVQQQQQQQQQPHQQQAHAPPFGGHLANISPSQFRDQYEEALPPDILGRDFLAQHGAHLDSVTTVDPAVRYAVRSPTGHPIHENFRVSCFRALLAATDALGDAAAAAAAAGADGASGASSAASSRPGSSGRADGGSSRGGGEAAAAAGAASELQRLAVRQAAAAAGLRSASSSGSFGAGGGAATAVAEPQPQAAAATEAPQPRPHGVSWPDEPAQQHDQHERQPQPAPPSAPPPAALLGPLEALGELMFQSHASYNACGLGSDGTNRLVHIVREHIASARAAGGAPALYGAKITGGGSGGTVCVLGLAGPSGQRAVDEVVGQYARETGYAPFVFAGSSMGAQRFGHLRLLRR